MVVDPGNGAQSLAAPYLLDMLGCKIITINSIIDGRFPGRGPEPTPETLGDLSAAVRAAGADFGVAYDGDGDRAIFCDENGFVYWGDQSGSLLADYLLERTPGATIVTPITSSQVVEVVAAKRRAKVIRTRVGSVDVSEDHYRAGAFFGFEENGGCIYPAHIAVRDGGMATALMLRMPCGHGGSPSPKSWPLASEVLSSEDEDTRRPREGQGDDEGHRGVCRPQGGEGRRAQIDRREDWVLVRPSGTEPIIRVFAESDTEEKVNALFRKFVKLVKSGSAEAREPSRVLYRAAASSDDPAPTHRLTYHYQPSPRGLGGSRRLRNSVPWDGAPTISYSSPP